VEFLVRLDSAVVSAFFPATMKYYSPSSDCLLAVTSITIMPFARSSRSAERRHGVFFLSFIHSLSIEKTDDEVGHNFTHLMMACLSCEKTDL
jgi:hypothetical protein